jgi:hypothetical protein
VAFANATEGALESENSNTIGSDTSISKCKTTRRRFD